MITEVLCVFQYKKHYFNHTRDETLLICLPGGRDHLPAHTRPRVVHSAGSRSRPHPPTLAYSPSATSLCRHFIYNPARNKIPTKFPVRNKIPTKFPVKNKIPTKFPVRNKIPTKFPVRNKIPTKFPVRNKIPTKFPVKNKISTKFPVRNKIPTKFPVRNKIPTKFPVKNKIPTKFPVRNKIPTKFPVKNKIPTKFPVRNKIPTKFPVRNKTPTKFPVRNKIPTKFPVRDKIPTKFPVRNKIPTKFPVKNASSLKQSLNAQACCGFLSKLATIVEGKRENTTRGSRFEKDRCVERKKPRTFFRRYHRQVLTRHRSLCKKGRAALSWSRVVFKTSLPFRCVASSRTGNQQEKKKVKKCTCVTWNSILTNSRKRKWQ